METSVIIPAFNENEYLVECVGSLRNQSNKDFEIIIIDDGSTDKTSDVLQNFQLTIPNFQFLEQKHKGAGTARNAGAKHAKGEILVFVDADMTFDKDFLSNLVKPIISSLTKGTFSKEEYVSNWDNIWAKCWNINEGWEEKSRHPANYPDYQPVFRAILKSEFDRVGGFTPGGYDDDWSLYRKLGYQAVNAPGAIFYHKNPSSLNEIFKHAKWVGKRKYKLGVLGYFVALMRSCFPVSFILGLLFAIRYSLFAYLIFKIVYDFGVFVGILEYLQGNPTK